MDMAKRHLVTAHQANYLPYLGFFEKISISDLFVLVDDTQFVKRGPFGWIHRNRILGPNGPQWLTIPVETHDKYDQLISEVKISQNTPWRRKHLKSIEVAYRKSPFYSELFPEIQDIYEREWQDLLSISSEMINWVLKVLKIETPQMRSSSLSLQGKSSDYVLELAQKTNATHYLSGMHGREYLDLEKFKEAKMELVFQDFKCEPYLQGKREQFTPYLSTLDALFSVGPESTRELLVKGSRYNCPHQG
jgi:hypothetical protein